MRAESRPLLVENLGGDRGGEAWPGEHRADDVGDGHR